MTRNEFTRRRDQLREVILRGLAYHTVWKSLTLYDANKVSWSLQEQNDVFGRFRGFFTPVGLALLDMALWEFAKVFDPDRRTASLTVLLTAARKDPTLVPRASAGDIDKLSRQLRPLKRTLKTVNQRRDQVVAHVDANPAPVDPLLTRDFDDLADRVRSVFNGLSSAHDGNVFGWEYPLRQAGDHCTAMLGILVEETRRRRKRHEEEMARIGLEEIERREASLGRRLDSGEMQSTMQSLGLTDQQMQRVEKEHDLT